MKARAEKLNKRLLIPQKNFSFKTTAGSIALFLLVSVLTVSGALGQDKVTPDNAFEFSNVTAEVPIPAAAWLFGSGLLALASLKRRKR